MTARRSPCSLAGTEGNAVAVVRACAVAAQRDGWSSAEFREWLLRATATGGIWSFLESVEERFNTKGTNAT